MITTAACDHNVWYVFRDGVRIGFAVKVEGMFHVFAPTVFVGIAMTLPAAAALADREGTPAGEFDDEARIS